MIGKVQVVSLSYKVHPATREMLMRYPKRELLDYANSLGVIFVKRVPKTFIVETLLRHNATICGGLGN